MMAREMVANASLAEWHGRTELASSVAQRHAAILPYDILDTLPERRFDDLARLASTFFGTRFAAISFIDDHRQWFKAKVELDLRETTLEESFCVHAVRCDEMLVVPDATCDPRFKDKASVTGDPNVRFYAGMPIHAADGTAIAALCVFDPIARPEGITQAERTTLTVLAAQVETELELRRTIQLRDQQAVVERELSEALQFMAEHDSLTGLPNRAVFHQRLVATMDDANAVPTRAAVMLVDVDHFKQVNDAFGHDAGDALLREFGARLRCGLRTTDTVARLGGDEFGALLHGVDSAGKLDTICRSLDQRLRKPLLYNGRLIDCRASIGIAIYPDHAVTPDALIECADLALASAKDQRGTIVLFNEDIGSQARSELKLLAQARTALADDAIFPSYQPKINLTTGTVAGYEALVRLRNPEGLCEHPSMFLTAFGNAELATAIGERMVTKVLDDMVAWRDGGVAFGHVAINSCAADYAANNFAERLLAQLAARDLDPRTIELEVTEGTFLGRGSH